MSFMSEQKCVSNKMLLWQFERVSTGVLFSKVWSLWYELLPPKFGGLSWFFECDDWVDKKYKQKILKFQIRYLGSIDKSITGFLVNIVLTS